ncbi:MAG TPA: exopolysaccharide biosynthesis polyprenyl glycosylphosphotransferase [Candidatus Gastranaerophilales bacterium]|nr:exopolysaccharide biosynthesis polyprenyl glycosylphosphotransferase [Candidatus Gastranaerophilales bacterium]
MQLIQEKPESIEYNNIPSRIEQFKNARKKNYKFLVRNFNLALEKPYQWMLKRIFDYCASFAGIILISPLLILTAILIKLDSQGPVFYKQKRAGLYGKEFEMYKFRSMKKNADKELDKLKSQNQTNELMFKMFNDPRITRIGKFIRKYSIDELPQLFNVLRGEMSLVGPRPPLPGEVQLYEKQHYLRFGAVPGLTGLWQVSGRSNVKNFNTVLEMDYTYIKNWNLFLDFKLLLKTVPVVLFAKNSA